MKANRRMAGRTLAGIGLALLGASVAWAGPPPSEGQATYDAIAAAASKGNRGAQDLKAAVDAYLANHDLSPALLGAPTRSARTESLGRSVVRIEGSAPWAVRISIENDLDSIAELENYRQDRHGSLAALVATDRNRIIRVVVVPNALVEFSTFAGSLECQCRGASIVVDVFSSRGWLMSSGRQLHSEDIANSTKRLVSEMFLQAGGSLDQFKPEDVADLRITVRRIEVDLPASEALALAARTDVLLVDPLTDLSDAYRGAAALVDVGPGPDAFYAFARLRLGDPFGNGPQPAKGEAK